MISQQITPAACLEQRPARPSRRRAAGLPEPSGVPGPSRLLREAQALSPGRGGPRGCEGHAGRRGPFGLQRADTSFPAKLEERGSEDARLAPQPGAKGTSPSPGATALPSRRGRSGSRTQERHLKGLGARRPLRARLKWFMRGALRASPVTPVPTADPGHTPRLPSLYPESWLRPG